MPVVRGASLNCHRNGSCIVHSVPETSAVQSGNSNAAGCRYALSVGMGADEIIAKYAYTFFFEFLIAEVIFFCINSYDYKMYVMSNVINIYY